MTRTEYLYKNKTSVSRMRHANINPQTSVESLVSSYLELSQKGTVLFIEETVFLQMIDLCNEEGNWRRALFLATEGIKQHPFFADLYLRKAQLLLNQHKIAESLVTIEQAEIFAPQNVNIRLLHAELLAVQGETAAALTLLADAKGNASRTERSEIYLVEAQIFGDLGRFKDMFEATRRALLADPSNTEGYEKMLWATEYAQKFDESIALHNQLIDRDAYNWRAWLNLGFAHEAKGALKEAIDAFEFAVAIDEKCRAAYMEAGELHLQTGDYLRAIYVYENAIFNSEEDALLLQRIGLVTVHGKQSEKVFANLSFLIFSISIEHESVFAFLYRVSSSHFWLIPRHPPYVLEFPSLGETWNTCRHIPPPLGKDPWDQSSCAFPYLPHPFYPLTFSLPQQPPPLRSAPS